MLSKHIHEAKGPTSDYWRTPIGITRRIEMLSQHFTYQVVNNSLMYYGESAGINLTRWVTMQDERVCPICGPLHGRVFRKGQFLAPLPAHANCRCRWELLVDLGPESLVVQPITLPKATGFEITAPDWHAMVRRESPTRILLLLFTVELLRYRTTRYNELERMMRQRGITHIELLVGADDEEAEYWRRRGYKVENGKLVKKI